MLKLKYIGWIFFLTFVLNGQERFTFYFDQDDDVPHEVSIQAFENWYNEQQTTFIIEKLQAFCDSTNTTQYNLDLAKRRNQNILNYLKENGLAFASNFSMEAIGEHFNSDIDLSKNRKVEIIFKTKEISPHETIEIQKKKVAINHPFLKKAQIETFKSEKQPFIPKPMNLNEFYQQLENSKQGDTIKIFDIHFYIDTPLIILKSEPYLDRIVAFMEQNKEVHIKIEGHMCCNIGGDVRLSDSRAKTIYRYLIKKGIARNRMTYEGKGVSRPLYPIPEKNSEEELKNRRVEIVVTKKNP